MVASVFVLLFDAVVACRPELSPLRTCLKTIRSCLRTVLPDGPATRGAGATHLFIASLGPPVGRELEFVTTCGRTQLVCRQILIDIAAIALLNFQLG